MWLCLWHSKEINLRVPLHAFIVPCDGTFTWAPSFDIIARIADTGLASILGNITSAEKETVDVSIIRYSFVEAVVLGSDGG